MSNGRLTKSSIGQMVNCVAHRCNDTHLVPGLETCNHNCYYNCFYHHYYYYYYHYYYYYCYYYYPGLLQVTPVDARILIHDVHGGTHVHDLLG